MVTVIDVDPETWANEYGIEPLARVVRADVRQHLQNALREHYVNELGVARDVAVTRP
jgi:hypothetical protein